MKIRKSFQFITIMAFCAFAFCPNTQADIVTTFDNGTFQGWTPYNLSGSIIQHLSIGGNPGGHIHAIDTTRNGGGFGISAPASYLGDLTGFSRIEWDENLLTARDLTISTTAVLIGIDGTKYVNEVAPGTAGAWRTRIAPLVASAWTLRPSTGTTSFENVLQNVAEMHINMDVNVGTIPTQESKVDNIALVPEPSTLLLLSIGLAAIRPKPKA